MASERNSGDMRDRKGDKAMIEVLISMAIGAAVAIPVSYITARIMISREKKKEVR